MLNTNLHHGCTSRKVCFFIFSFILTMLLIPIAVMADTSNVPKTGQTLSYQSYDDGDLEKGVAWPSPRFSDNDDGTVTDNLTNLVWLKNANCFRGNWLEALDTALILETEDCNLSDDSIATDWRVPNVRELESLLHMGVYTPAIPNTAGSGGATYQSPFSSLQANEYWTSTTNTASPSNALIVDIRYGHIKSNTKGSSYSSFFVRDNTSGTTPTAQPYATGQTLCYDGVGVISCAGTGQDGELQKGMTTAPPRFKDNFNGTVLDNLTGLTWLKNANCMGNKSDWSSAITFTNGIANGTCGLNDGSIAGDWRIPNSKELMSLLDYSSFSPALTPGFPFIGVQPTNGYWSSTTYSGFTGNAWFVIFNAGIFGSDIKSNSVAYLWPIKIDPIFTLTVSTQGDGSGEVTSSPAGISCTGECSSEFARYSSVYLTAQADSGSRFDGWSLGSCAKSKTCHVYMSSPQSVTATFIKVSATVPAWEILLLKD